MVVAEICGRRLLQVPSVQDNKRGQPLASNRSNQALGVGILPRALSAPPQCPATSDASIPRFHKRHLESRIRCGSDNEVFHDRRMPPQCAVQPRLTSGDQSRCSGATRGGGAPSRGIRTAPQPDGRNRKEISRYDLSKGIVEKRLPRLRGWPWNGLTWPWIFGTLSPAKTAMPCSTGFGPQRIPALVPWFASPTD